MRPDTTTAAILDVLQFECCPADCDLPLEAPAGLAEDDLGKPAWWPPEDGWFLYHRHDKLASEAALTVGMNSLKTANTEAPTEACPSLATAIEANRCPESLAKALLLSQRHDEQVTPRQRDDIIRCLSSWVPKSCSFYEAELAEAAERERDAPLCRTRPRLRYNRGEGYAHVEPRGVGIRRSGTVIATQVGCWVSTPSLDGADVQEHDGTTRFYYYEVSARQSPLSQIRVGWGTFENELPVLDDPTRDNETTIHVKKTPSEQSLTLGLVDVKVTARQAIIGVLLATNGKTAIAVDGELRQAGRLLASRTPRLLFPALQIVECQTQGEKPTPSSGRQWPKTRRTPSDSCEEKKAPLRASADDAKADSEHDSLADGDEQLGCNINLGSQPFVHDATNLAAQLSSSSTNTEVLGFASASLAVRLSFHGGSSYSCPVYALGAHAFERDARGATLELILKVNIGVDSILAWRCDNHGGLALCMFRERESGPSEHAETKLGVDIHFKLGFVLFDIQGNCPTNVARFVSFDSQKHPIRRICRGAWHHIAFGARRSRRGDDVSLFVDGVKLDTKRLEDDAPFLLKAATRIINLRQSRFGDNSALVIGAPAARMDETWEEPQLSGELGEARLWTERLSRRTVAASYSRGGVAGDEPRLAACWPIDEASGSAIRNVAVDLPKSWLGPPLQVDSGFATWITGISSGGDRLGCNKHVNSDNPITESAAMLSGPDNCNTFFFNDDTAIPEAAQDDVNTISISRLRAPSCIANGGATIPPLAQALLDAESALISQQMYPSKEELICVKTLVLNAIAARIFRLASAVLASRATEARKKRVASDEAFFPIIGFRGAPEAVLLAIADLLSCAATSVIALAAARWLRASLATLCEDCTINVVASADLMSGAARDRIFSAAVARLHSCSECRGLSVPCILCLEMSVLLTEGQNFDAFFLKGSADTCLVRTITNPRMPEVLRRMIFDTVAIRRRLYFELVPVMIRPRFIADVALDLASGLGGLKDDACAVPRVGDICRHIRSKTLGVITEILIPEINWTAGNSNEARAPFAQVVVEWPAGGNYPSLRRIPRICCVRLVGKYHTSCNLTTTQRTDLLTSPCNGNEADITVVIVRNPSPIKAVDHRGTLLTLARSILPHSELIEVLNADDEVLRRVLAHAHSDRFLDESCFGDTDARFWRASRTACHLPVLMDDLIDRIAEDPSARRLLYTIMSLLEGSSTHNADSADMPCQSPPYLVGRAPSIMIHMATCIAKKCISHARNPHLFHALWVIFERLCRFDEFSGSDDLLEAARSLHQQLSESRDSHDGVMLGRLEMLLCRVISNCTACLLLPREQNEHGESCLEYWRQLLPVFSMAESPSGDDHPTSAWLKELLKDGTAYADLDERLTRVARIPAALTRLGGIELDRACQFAVAAAMFHAPVSNMSVAADFESTLLSVWRQIPRLRAWATAQPNMKIAADRIRQNARFLLSLSNNSPSHEETCQYDPAAIFRFYREAKQEDLDDMRRALIRQDDLARCRAAALTAWLQTYQMSCKQVREATVQHRANTLLRALFPPRVNGSGQRYLPWLLCVLAENRVKASELARQRSYAPRRFYKLLTEFFPQRHHNLGCREFQKFVRLDGASHAAIGIADQILDNVYAAIAGLSDVESESIVLSVAAAWASRIMYKSSRRDDLTRNFIPKLVATSIRLEKNPTLSAIGNAAISLGLLACKTADNFNRNELTARLLETLQPCLLNRNSCDSILRLLLLGAPSIFASDDQWIELFSMISSDSWRGWRLVRVCSASPKSRFKIPLALVDSALNAVAARFRCDDALFPLCVMSKPRSSLLPAAAEACALLREVSEDENVMGVLASAIATGREACLDDDGVETDDAGVVASAYASRRDTVVARCLAALQVLGGFREWPAIGTRVNSCQISKARLAGTLSNSVYVVANVKEADDGVDICDVVGSGVSETATDAVLVVRAHDIEVIDPTPIAGTNTAGIVSVSSELGELARGLCLKTKGISSAYLHLVRIGAAKCVRLLSTCGDGIYSKLEHQVTRRIMEALSNKLSCVGATVLERAVAQYKVAGIAACEDVEVAVEAAVNRSRTTARRRACRQQAVAETVGKNATVENRTAQKHILNHFNDGKDITICNFDHHEEQMASQSHGTAATLSIDCFGEGNVASKPQNEDSFWSPRHSSSSADTSQGLAQLVEMGFSSDLSRQALEYAEGDIDAALNLVLADVAASSFGACNREANLVDNQGNDARRSEREDVEESTHAEEHPVQIETEVKYHGEGHEHKEDLEEQKRLPVVQISNRKSPDSLFPIHDGSSGDAAASKCDDEDAGNTFRSEDDKNEDRIFTCKTSALSSSDQYGVPERQYSDVRHGMSNMADDKNAFADVRHETATVDALTVANQTTFEDRHQAHCLTSQGLSSGLTTSLMRIPQHAPLEEDDDDSRWPRMYHVSARTTITLRAFPRASAARVLEVRGDDELIAFGESGDWLHVKVLVSNRNSSASPPVSTAAATCANGPQLSGGTSDSPPTMLPPAIQQQQLHAPWNKMSVAAAPAPLNSSQLLSLNSIDDGNHPLTISNTNMAGFDGILSTVNLCELSQQSYRQDNSPAENVISERAASESSAGVSASQASEITVQGDSTRCNQSSQQQQLQTGQTWTRRNSQTVHPPSSGGDLREISECSSVTSVYEEVGNSAANAEDTRNAAATAATGICQPLSLRTLSSRLQRESPVGAHRPSFVRHNNDDEEEDHDDMNNDGSVGECAVVASGSMIVRGDDSVAESSLFCYAFSHEGAPIAGSVVSETDRGTVLMFGENMSERESNMWGIESIRDDASLVSTSRGDLGIGDDGTYFLCESVSAADDPAGNLQGHPRRVAMPSPILVEPGTIRNLCLQGITGWIERSRVKLGPSPNCPPPTEEEQELLASSAFSSNASHEVQQTNENNKTGADFQEPLENKVLPAINSRAAENGADNNHNDFDLKTWTGLAGASLTDDGLAEVCDGHLSRNYGENKGQSITATNERCILPKDDVVTNRQNTDGDYVHEAGVIAVLPMLEAETGEEYYDRDDRYFGTRQGDAPTRCDDFRGKSLSRKAEAVAHDFVASSTTRKVRIPQGSLDKQTYVTAAQSLANSAAILVTLQFRQLLLALLLYWSSLAIPGGGLPCNRVVEFFVGQSSLCHQEVAQYLVAFYRLMLFRDWTPDSWPALLTSQILGAALTFPLGGTLLPALLTPLLSHLTSPNRPESSQEITLSRALRGQFVDEVRSHLEAASASPCEYHIAADSQLASRETRTIANEELRHASVGSRRGPLSLTDVEVSQRCCLPWAQWVSRIMFMCDSSLPTAEDHLLTDLFRAWLNCMNSSDLRLKQHAASELAAMLSSLVGRQATDVVSACIRELPMTRLHHLASWRLLREADSYPIVSRYLQSIIDLIATARVAHIALPDSNGQVDTVENSARSLGASLNRSLKADGDSRNRFALRFDGEGSMTVGACDVHPPWTAEFLIYRQQDDADPFLLSPASACEPMDVQWVPAICLATSLSTGHTIRLQKGGALLAGSEARKLCVGGVAFDYEVPIGRWVHLALVARERSPNSTAMLCGPRAYQKCGPVDEGHLAACTHSLAHKHVVELFADGESKGVVSCRAQLPCGQVGLDCPPKQKSVVDNSGILLGVSDEPGARAVLRRRSLQDNAIKSSPGAKHARSRRAIETTYGFVTQSCDDNDDAHLVLEEGGACAVRSPRCYLGMVRYWSVARTASDIKRYLRKHPPAVAATGLLGTWELVFDDVSSGSAVPLSIAPRFAADSNENHTGCELRGDASWIKLPSNARMPKLLQDCTLAIIPDHDTDRNIVLHGTVVRHKVPNVTFGPLCRPQTEALILRLAVQENDNIVGIVDWHDRSLAFMVQGRVTKRLTGCSASVTDEEPCWGDELEFELIVGEIVLGCDELALSPLHAVQELARYDDERSLDTCCVISPSGAKIWGAASAAREANHGGLAEVSGVWTGRIEYAADAVQAAMREFQLNESGISAKSPACRIDEATLPARLSLRPVYGDYACEDDDAAHLRRLLTSSTTGGHFCAFGTVIHDDGEQDVIFPPLSPRLEEAKHREEDVGSRAGELLVRASVAARDAADAILACAALLDDVADDRTRRLNRGAVEKRVQGALDLAEQAAAARRAAADAGTAPLPFEAASQRVKRRNAGPPRSLTNNCASFGQCPAPMASCEVCQSVDESAAAPLHSQNDDAMSSEEALPEDEMDDSLNNESSYEMLEDDDKEDKCVNEDSSTVTDGTRRHMRDRTRIEMPVDHNTVKWWGIGARCGKWCWEWDVRRVASGELAVGVVSNRADSSIKMGSDEYGWAYRSTGVVTHGGDHLVTASFGPGDVVGVEVEIFADEKGRKLGRMRFLKNGIEVAPFLGVEQSDSDIVDAELKRISPILLASKRRRNQIEVVNPTSGMAKMLNIDAHEAAILFDMTGTSPQRGGLRAAAQVGGAGDAIVFLGLKSGFGSRRSVPHFSFSDNPNDRTHCVESYSGEWGLTGVRHGRGELSYSHCKGRWIGAWYNDKQHGVHLWIEDGDATPVLFDRGQRVDVILSDTDACRELETYNNTLIPGSSDERRLSPSSDALDIDPDRGRGSSIKNSTEPGNPQITLWTLRVVYQHGATARIGIDIDSSEIVRRVEVGEELEAVERAVTADGVPRYKVRLRNEEADSCEYGWISEHLRGGARDVVCIVLRQVVCANTSYLRYRVSWAGGATIRAASALDSTKVGVAPQSTALWVEERVRLANGTLCLRVVAPKSLVGWVSEEEHILRREPTRHELAHEALLRERSCMQLSKRQSVRAQSLFDVVQSGYRERRWTCSGTKLDLPTALRQVTATFEASRRSPFLLDRRQCASGVDLSSDLLTATCVAPRAGRGVVLGTKLMRRGLHYWEVRVDQATWGSIFIGVAAHGDVVGADASLCDSTVCKRNLSDIKSVQPSRSTSHFHSRQQHSLLPLRSSSTRVLMSRAGSTTRSVPSAGWGGLGFVNYRATQAFGAEAGYGSYVGPGDIVGVLFDADKGTISFVKDGEDFTAGRPVVVNLGVAFSSIWRRAASRSPASKAGLYASFGLKGEGDSLSLRGCKSWSSLNDPLRERVPPRLAQLEVIINALMVLDSWRAHARLLGSGRQPGPERNQRGWRLVVEAATRIHSRWRKRRKVTILESRTSANVELETSRESIIIAAINSGLPQEWTRAALRLGAPCRVPQGEVRIVGVARGQIWFAGPSLDEGRAWYWTAQELLCAAMTGAFVAAPPFPNGTSEQSLQDTESPETQTEIPKSPPSPHSAECLYIPTNPRCPGNISPSNSNGEEAQSSGELALLEPVDFLISFEAEDARVDAPLSKVIEELAKTLQVVPALVPAAQLACAVGLERSTTDGTWHATQPESLNGVLATTIARRFALICALNDAVDVALPYVDLGRGDLALAELGDLRGGIMNTVRPLDRDGKAVLPEEATENETYMRTLGTTSYYGALAAAKADSLRPRTVQCALSRYFVATATERESFSAKQMASWRSQSKLNLVPSHFYHRADSWTVDESNIVAGLMGENNVPWSPDSWWAGAVPPCSKRDLECCSHIPSLHALVRPATRSWTGGRAIVDLRSRLFFHKVKCSFWWRILNATTTPTTPPADEYDRPDELREFQVNRLHSTQRCYAFRQDSAAGSTERDVEQIDISSQASRRGTYLRSAVQMEAEDDFEDDAANNSGQSGDSSALESARAFRETIEKQTVFGQLRAQMRSRCDARALRRAFIHVQDGGQPRAFYVKFIGEGVDDHGGPYRAVFQSALVDEPKLKSLGLLVDTPARELVLRANEDIRCVDDDFYRHFGRLLGVAGRHRVSVDLRLSRHSFWGPLAAQCMEAVHSSADALDPYESALIAAQKALFAIDDEESSAFAHNDVLEVFRCLDRRVTASLRRRLLRSDIAAVAFSTQISPARGVASFLCKSSENSNSKLNVHQLHDVCTQLSVSQRARARALASLVRGASATVPVELFSLFDAEQLEEIMCGAADVNLDELKRNARYESVNSDEPHINYFWQALENFNTRELAAFVEFCSGSARPPRGESTLSPQCLKITRPPPGADEKPDEFLPLSQTCFFSLALPRYSSAAVCAKRLRYATENAHLMDGDFLMRHSEGWDILDA